MAARYGARAYRDLDRFLEHRPMEVVLVGTPSGLHAEHARAAARQGLHVLVEKPLDVTTQRVDTLIEECDRAGVRLGVIFQDRAAPDLVWLKQLVAGGGLGTVFLTSARVSGIARRSITPAQRGAGPGPWTAEGRSPIKGFIPSTSSCGSWETSSASTPRRARRYTPSKWKTRPWLRWSSPAAPSGRSRPQRRSSRACRDASRSRAPREPSSSSRTASCPCTSARRCPARRRRKTGRRVPARLPRW